MDVQLVSSVLGLVVSVIAVASVVYAHGKFRGDTTVRIDHLEKAHLEQGSQLTDLFHHTMDRLEQHMAKEETESKALRDEVHNLSTSVAVLADRLERT
ncbi:MAG: hypothetical protein Q8R28_10360 [Dehalococcoidia bacterium]|nr:hypothetical protein [Dehalococcoidia bacterium]